MAELAGVSIEYPKQDTIVVTLDVGDVSTVVEDELKYRRSVVANSEDLNRSLHEIPELLSGNSASLLRFSDFQTQLKARPRDATTVHLDIERNVGETEISVPVSKANLCEELVSAARSYHRLVCSDGRASSADLCYCTTLAVSANDGERRIEYYQDNNTLDGYTPTIADEHLAAFASNCVHVDLLRELVVQSDDLEPFVQDLTEMDDDEFVLECYRNLLGSYEEVIAPTAEVLVEYPDERAQTSLQGVIWSDFDDESVTTALKALQQIPDADVVRQMVSFIELNGADAIEASLTAAEWLQMIDPATYLDDTRLDRFESELRAALDESTHQELKDAIEPVLEDLPSE